MDEQQVAIKTGFQLHIYSLNEKSVTISFGSVISEEILAHITAFNQRLLQNPFAGLVTTVPAYTTLTVFFDPLRVMVAELAGKSCYEKVSTYLKKINHLERSKEPVTANRVIIPVCYGGDFGPDILAVAQANNITEAEIIALHSAVQYTVYMIGFVPGFAYMGGMDARLATPRKEVPSAKIPAGSVGIAGLQTGIYPMEIPGGWQIIGKTPFKMFDAQREQPALLKGGDLVTFKAITVAEFNAYSQ